jgi:hypothetical protein
VDTMDFLKCWLKPLCHHVNCKILTDAQNE